jgi:hypothetical protein
VLKEEKAEEIERQRGGREEEERETGRRQEREVHDVPCTPGIAQRPAKPSAET